MPQLRAKDPVEQEEHAQKEQWAGNKHVGRPVDSARRGDKIKNGQSGEEYGASPFPAPRQDKEQQEDGGRDEVHGESERSLPESVMSVKDVQGEHADECGKEEAEDSGSPEQEMFDRRFHIGESISSAAARASIDSFPGGID